MNPPSGRPTTGVSPSAGCSLGFAPRAPTAGLPWNYLDESYSSPPRIGLKPARLNDPLAQATGPARVEG